MGDMIYREARLEEYEKIGKLLAKSFLDYPFLTIITDNLKKPDSYSTFVEAMQTMLTRVYIQKGNCLVAEQDGELLAVALLQQKDFCILSYLRNGGTNIFRYIRPRNLFKYFDFVKRSKKHLEQAGEFDWYLMALAVNIESKGQGIGSTFLKQGIEPYVKSKGCKHLGFITSTARNTSFYEKNDYELLDFIELEYGSKSIGNWAFLKTMNKS
ncbi:GNAT family N-acetyltransferase [Streptococcus mitis]|uniref:GNAT family N-acetyltransferase n=1 Tax=Streptococcus mitis TaxID=28037 RepID=UPI0039C0E8F8